ncbi:MFS transporter [Nonomuraea ferruginea]
MTAPKALDTPYDAPRIFGPAYRTATLGILLVVTLVAFEGMSVSVIMPEVSKDLRALELYGVSFSAFFIASLFANVVAGLWADRRGYALPFLAGLVLFVLGMALAGAATGKEMFLLARAVQGLGAGPTVVALYVMIARVYPQDVRPRVFAALSAAWVLPSMIGPSVAGFVAEHLGWRWVFYGIIPLVVPALLMLLPSLRRLSRRPRARHRPALAPDGHDGGRHRHRRGQRCAAVRGRGAVRRAAGQRRVVCARAGGARLRAGQAAAAGCAPVRPRAADDCHDARAVRRRVLRGQRLHPARPDRRQGVHHRPGGHRADHRGARLVG